MYGVSDGDIGGVSPHLSLDLRQGRLAGLVTAREHDGVRALSGKGDDMTPTAQSLSQANSQSYTQLDIGALLFRGGQRTAAKPGSKGKKK